jgi:endonuclease/exonuclease/phosphatase family metal-dependent hydrolase
MRWIAKLAALLHSIFCGFTFLAYALCFWSVSAHWIAGFIMMSIPILVLIHLVCVFGGYLFGVKGISRNSILMIILAFPFAGRTYQFGNSEENAQAGFRIMSYNVHQFGHLIRTNDERSLLSEEGIDWIKTVDADLLVFQEIYHKLNSSTDPVAKLGKLGYKNFVLFGSKVGQKPLTADGLAIFSKHPLRAVQQERFAGQNGLLKADVLLGDDTITVINVHLQSMTLNLNELSEQREVDGIKGESKKTLSKLKRGFLKRNEQVELLEKWAADSKYPVIVCGDFNETPYSYLYGRLSKRLMNSFEKAGKGFGFTFRNLPYFIRIDNLFFDPDKIGLTHFETDRSANFSDHRPLVADYFLLSREAAD